MAIYVNNLTLNTVLIGVTADEAQKNLTPNAKSALLDIGVNVNGLVFKGKASFVALIGQPAMSVSQVAPPGGNSLVITVRVTGTSQLYLCFNHYVFDVVHCAFGGTGLVLGNWVAPLLLCGNTQL